jgi:hypothetical protein
LPVVRFYRITGGVNRVFWPVIKWGLVAVAALWCCALAYGLVSQPKVLLQIAFLIGWLVGLSLFIGGNPDVRCITGIFIFGIPIGVVLQPFFYWLLR